MIDPAIPIFVDKVWFEEAAELEGQVLDGFKVHSVDRAAGTLCIGAHRFKLMELVDLVDDMLALCEADPIQTAGDTEAPRGAQWKREKNRHRRAW